MKTVFKVGAFIIRPNPDGFHDLLLFTHPDFPDAPIQIPGGTVEQDEAIEDALSREILEETGLAGLEVERKLGVSRVSSLPIKDEILERHCFLLWAPNDVKEEWIHTVQGLGIDAGLRFAYRWHSISSDFTLSGDLGFFLSPEHIPEIYRGQ